MVVNVCPSRETLLQYSVGMLSGEQRDALDSHLDCCSECQATIMTLDDADDTVIGRLRTPVSSESFLAEPQLQDALAAAMAMPPQMRSAAENSDVAKQVASDMPETLGEYRILEELGRGGMGRVYKALHTKLDRVVAVKVLPRGRVGDQKAIVRFEREMKAVGRLAHPNIVQAHDAREIGDTPVLIMEFVDGLDLAEIVRRLGPVSLADACELVRQTALALQCAHEHGLVHRDIKPSNIMLARSGEVKLLDLGLARFYAEGGTGISGIGVAVELPPQRAEEMTGMGQAMGTADYMAPEQACDSRTVDIRADLYSLGCTFYKLLSGRAPFSGPEYRTEIDKLHAHVRQPVPFIRRFVADVPEKLAAILDRLLAKDPDDRFATPAEVAEALAPWCVGADLPALLQQAVKTPRSPLLPGDVQGEGAGTGPFFGGQPYSAGKPSAENMDMSPSASRGRGSFIRWVAVALLFGGFGFALGILITINRDGKKTTIDLPDGSTARVSADGKVDVTLPSETRGDAGKQDAKPPVFRTAKVTRGDITATISAIGTLEPEEIREVGNQVAGTIVKLGDDPRGATDPNFKGKTIDYLSPVEEGTVLAVIDGTSFKTKVEQEQAGLERAEADMTRCNAKLKSAESNFARANETKNTISQTDYEKAQTDVETVRAEVAAARAVVNQHKIALASARTDLERTVIKSPVNGVIISRRVNLGQNVAPDKAASLFLIAKDIKNMQIWTLVSEADISRIKTGMEANFTVDAIPNEVFRAKVVQVRLDATVMQNVVCYTVVLAGINNPDSKLMPYMTANVQFQAEKHENVLRVPNAALRWTPRAELIVPGPPSEIPLSVGGNGHIWRKAPDGQHVQLIDVCLGLTDGRWRTEISGPDVKEGMEVVIGERDTAKTNPVLPQPAGQQEPKKGQGITAIFPELLDGRDEYEQVSVLFPLNKAAPREVVVEVQRLLGPHGSFNHTWKRLTVIDEAGRARQIRDLLNQRGLLEAAAPPLQFGPVIERVVNALSEGKGNDAIDLAAGRLIDCRNGGPASERVSPQLQHQWCKENNVDLLVDFTDNGGGAFNTDGGDRWALVPEGLKLGAMEGRWGRVTQGSLSPWDHSAREDLQSALASPTPGTAVIEGQGPFAPTALVQERRGITFYELMQLPATFAFQTRKGDLGILQVLRFTEEPRGMRIRYKLVQPSVPSAVGAADTTLLYFYADGAAPCREMASVVDTLASEGYAIQRVNIEQERKLVAKFRVTNVPCFVVLKQEREVDRVVGSTTLSRLRAALGRPSATGTADVPDEKAIQGTWEIVSSTFGLVKLLPGREGIAPEEVLKTTKVVITDDTLKIVGQGVTDLAFQYRLNPAAKTKMIDLKTPGTTFGLVSYGIYEIEGNQLKICTSGLCSADDAVLNRPDARVLRPTEFWAELGSDKELLVLRRVGDAAVTEDEKAIQGSWQVEEAGEAAKAFGFAQDQRIVFSRHGVSTRVTIDRGREGSKGDKNSTDGSVEQYDLKLGYAIDPTQKPKRIDLATVVCPSLESLHGIYELDGDRLTIAWATLLQIGKTNPCPPSQLAAGPDSTLVVLKRVTGAAKKARKQAIAPEKPEAKAPAVSPAAELKALQGPWKVVRVEKGKDANTAWTEITQRSRDAHAQPDDPGVVDRLDFREDLVHILDFKMPRNAQFTYAIDPDAATKTIDFSDEVPNRGLAVVAVGIYEIDGDQLRICVTSRSASIRESSQRPKSFKIAPDSANILFVLKREPAFPEDEKAIECCWWKVVSQIDDGKPVPKDSHLAIRELEWFFGYAYHYFPGDAPPSMPNPTQTMKDGLYVLDAAKRPKQIDMFPGPGEGRRETHGIYKFDGDRLTIAYRGDGPRPEAFESTPGSGVTLLVLEKKKPQEPTADQPSAGVLSPPTQPSQPQTAEPRPPAVSPAAELKALQGPWKIVQIEEGKATDLSWTVVPYAYLGTPTFRPGMKPAVGDRLDFRNKRTMEILTFAEGTDATFSYRIDPAASPKTIELLQPTAQAEAAQKPRDEYEETVVASGIYELDDNRLRICLTRHEASVKGNQRPKSLVIDPDSGDTLFVLERYQLSEDEKAFQGGWKIVSKVQDGKNIKVDGLPGGFRLFDSYSFWCNTAYPLDVRIESHRYSGHPFVLDSTTTPKTITMLNHRFDTPPKKEEWPGIYKFEGDRLVIAYRENEPRPEAFESKPGSGVTLLVLERKKPPEPAAEQPSAGIAHPLAQPTQPQTGEPNPLRAAPAAESGVLQDHEQAETPQTPSSPPTVAALPSNPDGAARITPEEFARLSEDQQKAALLDGIQRIQRRCANISLNTTSQVSKVDVDPRTKQATIIWEDFGTSDFELRRIGASYRIAIKRYRPGSSEPAERCTYHHNAESGVNRKLLTTRLDDGSDRKQAWISKEDFSGFGSGCRYASYLAGWNVVGFPENDFFGFVLEHRADLRIRGIDQQSRLVEVSLSYTSDERRRTGTCTMWFDLGKDWMLRRRVWEAKTPGTNDETYVRFEVAESEQFEGVWLPTRFTDVMLSSGGGLEKPFGNLWKTTAENIKIGGVKKEDLDIVFPTGTLVRDDITGDRWSVGTAGERMP